MPVRNAIIVDAFSTGRYLAALLATHGYRCHHVQSRPNIRPLFLATFQPATFAGPGTIHSGNLDAASVAALAAALAPLHPELVLAGSELGVPIADLLADALAIRNNGTRLAWARRDKWLMQEALRDRSVAAIKTRRVESAGDAQEAAREIGYPVVVKPVMSAGAEDVVICRNADEVGLAAKTILGKSNVLSATNSALLVQECLNGTEYIINAVSCEGEHRIGELFRCRKTVRDSRRLSALEELIGPRSDEEYAVCRYALAVLHALEIKHGPTHLELIYTQDGPRLIELAARMQGAVDPEALIACTGTSHPHLTVEAIVHPRRFLARPTLPPHPLRPLYRVIFLAPRSGLLRSIPGLETMSRLASHFSHSFCVSTGDFLPRTVDFVTAPGCAHLVHHDARQLEADYTLIRVLEADNFFDLESSHSISFAS